MNGNVTIYNTADQSFLKVQFDGSTNIWTAWAKDGTVYTFDKPVKDPHNKWVCRHSQHLNITWRWSLGAMTDKNGNSITYSYYKEPKSTNCANEIAVYPLTITYPHNHYRIHFVPEARTDYQNSWTTTDARSLYSTQRLKEILVEHDPTGNWTAPTQVRKYVFGYATDTATANVIFPRFHWSGGGHTLTLTSVQEISGDGTLSLPATTFYYGDENGDNVDEFMHLTKVDNGLGGQVEMQYARWSYFDDFNDALRSLQTEYGATNQECGPVSGNPGYYYGTQWTAVQGAPYVRCDPSSHRLQIGNDNVNGQPATLAIGHRSIPEHVVKPGSLYRFISRPALRTIRRISIGVLSTPPPTPPACCIRIARYLPWAPPWSTWKGHWICLCRLIPPVPNYSGSGWLPGLQIAIYAFPVVLSRDFQNDHRFRHRTEPHLPPIATIILPQIRHPPRRQWTPPRVIASACTPAPCVNIADTR